MNINTNSSKEATTVTNNTNKNTVTSNKHKVYSGRKILSLGGFVYLLLLPKPMAVNSLRLLSSSTHIGPDKNTGILGIRRTTATFTFHRNWRSVNTIDGGSECRCFCSDISTAAAAAGGGGIVRNIPLVVSTTTTTRATTDIPTISRRSYRNIAGYTKALFAYNPLASSSHRGSHNSSRRTAVGSSTKSSRNSTTSRLFATSSAPQMNMYHLDSIGSTQDEARRILQDETLHGTLYVVCDSCEYFIILYDGMIYNSTVGIAYSLFAIQHHIIYQRPYSLFIYIYFTLQTTRRSQNNHGNYYGFTDTWKRYQPSNMDRQTRECISHRCCAI